MNKTLIAAAMAGLALAGCSSNTHVTPTNSASHHTQYTPTGLDLRTQLGCDHVTPGDQIADAMPESDMKVEELFGCTWADYNRQAIAVRLGSPTAAKTYFGDVVQAGAKKAELDGCWVFIGSDNMARYFAHEAYAKAVKSHG